MTALSLDTKNLSLKEIGANDIESLFNSYAPKFEKMLGRADVSERFMQAALMLAQSESLSSCKAISVIGAVFSAATLNLSLSPNLGQAYILPYSVQVKDRYGKQKTDEKGIPMWEKLAQFQIGYAGYKELMYRSSVQGLYGTAVYKGDEFKAMQGLNPILEHKQNFSSTDIERVYITWIVNNQKYFEQKPLSFFENLRQRNKDQQKNNGALSGAWKTDYEAMCLAKLIKYCRRFLPMTPELNTAFDLDEQVINITENEKGETKIIKHDVYEDAEIVKPQLSAEKEKQIQEIKENIEDLDFQNMLAFWQQKKEWHKDVDILPIFLDACKNQNEVLKIGQAIENPKTTQLVSILNTAYKNKGK